MGGRGARGSLGGLSGLGARGARGAFGPVDLRVSFHAMHATITPCAAERVSGRVYSERVEEPRQYPPYVRTQEDIRRWESCQQVAIQSSGEPEHSAAVWQMTRTLYHSDIPTDVDAEGEPPSGR